MAQSSVKKYFIQVYYFVTLLSYHCAALDWLQKLYDERHAKLSSRIYQPGYSKPLGNENFNTKTNDELER